MSKEKKTRPCKICGKSISYLKLSQHIKSVHCQPKFSCKECDKIFTRKDSLAKHINAIHLKIQKFNCQSCHFKSNQKSNLERHILRKHSPNSTEYACNQCDYRTKIKYVLQSHIESKHFEQNLFKCDLCGKAYAESSNLIKHKRKH